MQNPNPNPNPAPQDGKDGAQINPWDAFKGQKDENGIPKHPEEKAEYFQKKASESVSEAGRIVTQNKTLQEENERLKNPNSPVPGNVNTINELSLKIPNWNLLEPAQQTAILNSYSGLHSEITEIKKSVAGIVDKQEFDRGYKNLLLDPKFIGLQEFKEEFIAKSYLPENLKTPLRALAIEFLADKGKWGITPAPSNDDDNPDAGRSGLDDGTPGGTPPAVPNTYTSEEAKELRTADPRKYGRLVREGKLLLKD